MRTNGRWTLALSLIVASTLAFAQPQDPGPVAVTLESYLVVTETRDDGTVVERFTEATSAFPGQVVEYRVIAVVGAEAGLPARTLALIGPIPEGTDYVLGSATPSSDELTLEASLDGDAFEPPPLLVTTTDADGREVVVEAEASAYRALRWSVVRALHSGDRVVVAYRVTIR
jgi:hypothetical protein